LYNGGRYNQFNGENIDPASNGNDLNSRVFKENMDKNNANYKSESNNGSVVNQVSFFVFITYALLAGFICFT
jgi:hypothetical protein